MSKKRHFQSKHLADIDLKSGKLEWDSFAVDPTIPYEDQEFELSCCLILIGFGKKNCVDVGWYPEFNTKGSFRVVVILNSDWDNPVYDRWCKAFKSLKKCLQEAINIADQIYNYKRGINITEFYEPGDQIDPSILA